jgi:hypothetical protein
VGGPTNPGKREKGGEKREKEGRERERGRGRVEEERGEAWHCRRSAQKGTRGGERKRRKEKGVRFPEKKKTHFPYRFLFSWPNSKVAVMGSDQLVGVMTTIGRDAAVKAGTCFFFSLPFYWRG